jgi:hypothetical protein
MRSTLEPLAEANTIETVRLTDEGDIGASLVENQPVTNQGDCSMSEIIAGICVPDSAIARAATQFVRDTEDDLLYNHGRRVSFGAR